MGYDVDSFFKKRYFPTLDLITFDEKRKKEKWEIKSVLVNKKKRLITVVFSDKDVRIIKCNKEDHFDVSVGVALAISEHLFGSKTQRNKWLEKHTKYVKGEK